MSVPTARMTGLVRLLTAMGVVVALAATGRAYADPPPWAESVRSPADSQVAYRFPAGLKDGRCRPDMFDITTVARLVGRADTGFGRPTGGASSNQNHALANTAIGTLLASVDRNSARRGLPAREEICFSQSFEHVPDRITVAWFDPTLSVHYSVIATRTVRTRDGRYCREYAAKATVNGHAADVQGTACRHSDGSWFLID